LFAAAAQGIEAFVATLEDLFRTLSAFSPPRADLRKAPWDDYVEWAVSQGLAPLAAYNLEYRLAGGGAPDWVRDRLLGIYQGLLNDNVMKLVNFKRSIDALEGRRVAMIGSAAFAENLYPHVAFRPVAEIRLLVPPSDVQALAGFLSRAEFKPAPTPEGEALAPDLVVSDTRTAILIHGGFTGSAEEDQGLLARAQPVRVYGPSMFRLTREDALLVQVLLAAKAGFDVPFIEWVDLRELVLGSPDAAAIHARAKAWKLERALYAAAQVVVKLFPETAAAAARISPELALPVRKLLDVSVVDPAAVIGRTRTSRSGEVLRALLSNPA
jgi:hypothetical protein